MAAPAPLSVLHLSHLLESCSFQVQTVALLSFKSDSHGPSSTFPQIRSPIANGAILKCWDRQAPDPLRIGGCVHSPRCPPLEPAARLDQTEPDSELASPAQLGNNKARPSGLLKMPQTPKMSPLSLRC